MKCGLHQSRGKMLLLQRCALHKVHVVDGQNTCNWIMRDERSKYASDLMAFCAFHSFLVEVQMKLAIYVNAMHA